MITYYKPISWSRIKETLQCPKKLQFFIDKTPARFDDTYYMAAGMVVQRAFELYYSRGIYKVPSRQNVETLVEIAKRLVDSKWAETELRSAVTFKGGRTPESYWVRISSGITGGYRVLEREGLATLPLQVETMWRGTHDKLKIFAKIDFLVSEEGGAVKVYDGKLSDHKQDLNQLYFYALTLRSLNYRVQEIAFIYYLSSEIDRIATTEDEVNALLDKFLVSPEFQRASKIFTALKLGVKELPATPETYLCRTCQYNWTCSAWKQNLEKKYDGLKTDNESRLSEIDGFATLR